MMLRPTGITISYGGRNGGVADSRPVVARIFGFAEGGGEPISHEMVVPAGERVEQELPHGLYNVELTLPSGRLIQRNVKINEDTHEDFQFLDDFGSADSFSLQETVSHHKGDVLAQAADADADREGAEVFSKSGQAINRQSVPTTQKGFASISRRPRRIRAPKAFVPNLFDAGASLRLKKGWSPEPADEAPTGTSWASHDTTDVHSGRFLWRIESKTGDHPNAQNRQWARIEKPDRGVEIASIPLPWFCLNEDEFATADILFDPARHSGASTTVAVNDVALSGLLSFLDRGQAAAAGPILDSDSVQALVESTVLGKIGNPLAACAAGYVGLAAFPPDRRERYDPWLKNCMERFPEIPDAAIINARRLVLRPRSASDNERAAAALRQACRAGVPYFSTGVVLLREMLLQLSSDHTDLVPLADKIGLLISRVDTSQLFTVLRYAPPPEG